MQGEGQTLAAQEMRPSPGRDTELVAAVATGDRDALAMLYDMHSEVVLGLARRILGPGAAEDLLHDVFLEVWHHAADYSPERGSVRAWLLVRARSRALDRLGKRVRDARVAEAAADRTESPLSGGTLDARESAFDAHRVRRLVGQLDADLCDVLELAYFEGLSCSEIALRLRVPVGTVKSRLARALARLREAIGCDECGEHHG
jgi:RNA polymerase sigma-70 factor (ECF subfamily)